MKSFTRNAKGCERPHPNLHRSRNNGSKRRAQTTETPTGFQEPKDHRPPTPHDRKQETADWLVVSDRAGRSLHRGLASSHITISYHYGLLVRYSLHALTYVSTCKLYILLVVSDNPYPLKYISHLVAWQCRSFSILEDVTAMLHCCSFDFGKPFPNSWTLVGPQFFVYPLMRLGSESWNDA